MQRMSAREAVPTSTVFLPDVASDATGPTLREVVDTLGPYAMRVIYADGGLMDTEIGEPTIQGVGERLEDVDNSIVLLAGGRASRPETLELIHDAGEAGCKAIVVKGWEDDLDAAAQAAEQAKVALLCTPDEMAWRHLDALITAAQAAATPVRFDTHRYRQGDLFALANAIAGSVGGAVTIEETSGRVMAYSSLLDQEIDEIRRLAILGRQTPERPTNSAEYRAIMQASGPVLFESSRADYASRLAIAVRAGHQVLGIIFVIRDRPPLVEDAESVLVDAARAAALHLLRARGERDPDRARKSEVLRGLVTGTLEPTSAGLALGLEPGTGYVLGVVRPASPVGHREADAARIADIAALHGEYWSAGSTIAVVAGQVLLLLPIDRPAPEAHLSGAEAARLAERLRKLGSGIVDVVRRSSQLEVLVGFTPLMRQLSDLAAAFDRAQQVVATLQTRGGSSQVACLQDVRADVVVGGLRADGEVVADDVLLPTVRAILEHDAEQGTSYAETLLTYLGTFGDVVATAKALNIHENTARYRVRRLKEMFDIELAGGDEALVTWLQVRMLKEDVFRAR